MNWENSCFSPCCDFMDFPSELTNNVYTLPLENIGDKKYLINAKLTTTACANTETSSKMREQKSIVAEERRQRRIDGLELFENTKLDSLIIATKYDSLSILKHLINYLNISSHFVIYSQFVQGLLECYKYLKQRGGCIHVELSDSWLREYQILENRTHPLIRMSGTSGYLLSGIIVDNN
ncbi:unnamed protein product [Didymodactylos carnosus]|uniref:tRNA (adenine(58)-N(1))-methyltransferase non-catalytic subunit TRM6 n=1 Tax=Didymodactylos carnosus TaxID=1234261 RepID=A0A8S2D457_9BILA|nr:unnamed protein product [Didymodactylos carnosus]CAF3658411.1 unnamed protein product [Didymodactylos carnosus]